MTAPKYELPGGVVIEPTPESRRRLRGLGIESQALQDQCYDVLARGLAAAESSRVAERRAADDLVEHFLATRR